MVHGEETYGHRQDCLAEERVKHVNLFAVSGHLRIVHAFVDLEVGPELLQDLAGQLLGQLLQGVGHLARLPREDLHFLALDDPLELGALEHEPIEQGAALLNKAVVLVAEHLLLGDAGHEAAGPALVERHVQHVELVVPAHDLEAALAILSRDRVLDDGADLLGVGDAK